MLIRHCDQCNRAMNKYQPYIQVGIEADEPPKLVAGLPLTLQGDFCGIGCLTHRLKSIVDPGSQD